MYSRMEKFVELKREFVLLVTKNINRHDFQIIFNLFWLIIEPFRLFWNKNIILSTPTLPNTASDDVIR